MLNTPITPPRVQVLDPRTGTISRAWYQFFLSLSQLTDGSTLSLDDVQKAPASLALDELLALIPDNVSVNDGVLEQVVELYVQTQGFAQAPLPPSPSELIAELTKRIEAIESHPRHELGTIASENTGATGSFTAGTTVITVVNGIITSIV